MKLSRIKNWAMAVLCLTISLLIAAGASPPAPDQVSPRMGDGRLERAVERWPADGQISNGKPPFVDVVRAYIPDGEKDIPVTLTFNGDATESHLLRPKEVAGDAPAKIVLETTDSAAGQHLDGHIVFLANHALVHGQTAKLESHPGNQRIGLWRDPKDFVTWDYKATRPGRYEVFVTYSCAEKDGTKITVDIGKQQFEGTLKTTEKGWYGYTWEKLGTVAIPAAGPLTVTVRCQEMVGGAVMNLKAITLIPACEGTLPVQAADGVVTLHARDVTIHGVQVQYEPKPAKNTIGYWTHTTDTVSWNFTINKPGKFAVQILQGCGKGQGGSKVVIEVAGQKVQFTVEDTGHFQNFVPRIVGDVTLDKPGKYVLKVVPTHKAGAAVMDLRKVRLLPK